MPSPMHSYIKIGEQIEPTPPSMLIEQTTKIIKLDKIIIHPTSLRQLRGRGARKLA